MTVVAEAVTLAIAGIITYEFIFMVIDDFVFYQVTISLVFPMYFVTGFVLACLTTLTMHCSIRIALSLGQLVGDKPVPSNR